MRLKALLVTGAALLVLAAVFSTRFTFIISMGDSMQPTLCSRELLLVDRAAYRHVAPARGEIVVARHLGGWIIKRVVGLPGERVQVREGTVLVDDQPVPATHPALPGTLEIEPGKLQADRYAVLGDNRSISPSENIHAVVAREQILGRVLHSLPLGGRRILAKTPAAGPASASRG